jgi:steroid delta-isomerase-like uncharacterized protein
MSRLAFLVSLVVLLSISATNPTRLTLAQDASPAAGVSDRMDVAQTRAVIEPYVAALGALEDIAPYLADDVVLTLVEVDQEIQGRDAVAGAIDELHHQTFDARPEVVNLVVGEGKAAGEFVFVGTHTGEFAGIPATGRSVRVPYTVFYDLSDGKITALRLQGFASGLVAAITAEAMPAAGTPSA